MNRIREKRVRLGWTMRKTSKIFGIPYRTWQNWERELSTPPKYVENLVVEKLDKLLEERK